MQRPLAVRRLPYPLDPRSRINPRAWCRAKPLQGKAAETVGRAVVHRAVVVAARRAHREADGGYFSNLD
jgi:hypothetical protein